MLDTPNPRNPGSSLLSCSLIVSMAPVPQTPLRVFLCDKHYFSLIIFRIVSVVPAKVSVVIESFVVVSVAIQEVSVVNLWFSLASLTIHRLYKT